MVVCFISKTGHVETVPLEQPCTINSEWYTTISLVKFEKRTRKVESLCNNGNASSRKSAQISAFLIGQNVELMGQPPYILDLAPNDFFLFPHNKKIFNDFRQTPIFVKLVFSSLCKQHKWWSYVKTFWVQWCLKMSNFPIKMSNCILKNMPGQKLI